MPAARPCLARLRTPSVGALIGALALAAGCSSNTAAGAGPNTAGSASAVAGLAPKLGQGSSGGITVTGTSITRTGTQLSITAKIHNDESTADELAAVSSNVSPTHTLSSPVTIPAGGTVSINGTTHVVLDQNGRLSPGGTVALSFQFNEAGAVQVFSSFQDAP